MLLFSKADGRFALGFVMVYNEFIVCASATEGSRMVSIKEAEMGVIYFALSIAKERGLSKGPCSFRCSWM